MYVSIYLGMYIWYRGYLELHSRAAMHAGVNNSVSQCEFVLVRPHYAITGIY